MLLEYDLEGRSLETTTGVSLLRNRRRFLTEVKSSARPVLGLMILVFVSVALLKKVPEGRGGGGSELVNDDIVRVYERRQSDGVVSILIDHVI